MNRTSLPESLGIEKFEIVRGEDAIRIAHNWLAAFCPSRTSFKGIFRFKTYMWDIMDCEFESEEATQEYNKHEAPTYIIMEDCFGQDEKVVYVVSQKPTSNEHLQDFHIFPKNLAWSMAFTHEDGWIGPKFSKHNGYEKLNKKNKKAVEAMRRNYV